MYQGVLAMDSYDEIYAAIAFGIPCFFLLGFLVASFLSCHGPFELRLLVVFLITFSHAT